MTVWKKPLRLGLQARIIALRNQTASVQVVLEQRQALAETVAAQVDYNIGSMLDELAGAAAAEPGFDLADDERGPGGGAGLSGGGEGGRVFQKGVMRYE